MGNSLLSITDNSLLLSYSKHIIFVDGFMFLLSLLVTLVCWSYIMDDA